MGGGSSKPKKVPTPQISQIDRAVLDLKNARDRLTRYRAQLQKDDAKLVAQAKKARDAGKKQQALGLLRLRKYKEAQAANCEAQLLNVLQMVETIDSKQNEAQVLAALQAGKNSLKTMHEERTVEDVLDLMDAVREEIEVEQEINQILENVPELSPADEAAVEAEMEALQAEMNGETTSTTTTPAVDLPVAPTTKLPDLVVPATEESQSETRVAVPG
jgi:hypothetical protein